MHCLNLAENTHVSTTLQLILDTGHEKDCEKSSPAKKHLYSLLVVPEPEAVAASV